MRHVINITDVGHLTSDADTGEDKLEKAASREGRSALAVAKHYTEAFWRDIGSLNIRAPSRWAFATDHVADMIAFARKIAPAHCYPLETGLYFDTSTVPAYGSLARSEAGELRGRIEEIPGKRNPATLPSGASRSRARRDSWNGTVLGAAARRAGIWNAP